MAHWKKFIYAVTALFFLPLATQAQKAETFTHTIKQGETVYSIARLYRVLPESILRWNPSASAGIKAGETLVIPQGQNAGAKERFHTIQAGETLYKLTKLYQVGADEICKANPGLTADNFKVGMVVRIPVATLPAQTEPAPANPPASQGIAKSGCREMHKVKRKETVYSIARDFNVSVAELKEANPEMNRPDYKLRRGDFVCIPYPKPQQPVKEEKTPSNEELMEKKVVAAPQKKISMGVILPFKDGTQSEKMVEFYRGVLMAVEEAKKGGTSVDVFAYDSGKSAGDIQKVLDSHPVNHLDFIVGPLHAEQIAPLSAFCQRNRIKLVVPFSSLGDEVYANPYYYGINPPKSYFFAEAAQLVTELFGKANIVFLEGSEKDSDAEAFIDAVGKRLQQTGGVSARLKLNDDEAKWKEAMNLFKDNVIIPNSSSIKMLNQMFPKLKEFTEKHPEYRIKLAGYPEWQTYTSNHLENFYKFDTYAYSSFYRNPLDGNAEKFEGLYQKAFHEPTLVSWPCFGMLGFDTATFFLKGIAAYGKAFDQHLHDVSMTPYQHRFDFQRLSNWSGFINREVEFIHYSPSHSIELIRLKK